MKPHWQLKHDWWLEDLRFEIEQGWGLKMMLRKHPDGPLSDLFRDMVKMVDKKIKRLRNEYKAIYGYPPKLTGMRKEVERETV